MENLVFIMWLILFPFFSGVGEILKYKYGERTEYSKGDKGLASLIMLLIWAYVGSLLYIPH